MGAYDRPWRRQVSKTGAIAVVAAMAVVGTGEIATANAAPGLVSGTPCTATARACVDRAGQNAWLIRDGQVVRGPLKARTGGAGKETPVGTFRVEWKDKDHHSREFNNAPMPYSVFFAPGGIAFHEGSLRGPSAGCVRLAHSDAVAFFDGLQVGDEVQIH